VAKLVNEFEWDRPVDFSNFFGDLVVTGVADMAATVILLTPVESATMPVAEVP
jgi:hypothetical protein